MGPCDASAGCVHHQHWRLVCDLLERIVPCTRAQSLNTHQGEVLSSVLLCSSIRNRDRAARQPHYIRQTIPVLANAMGLLQGNESDEQFWSWCVREGGPLASHR